MRRTRGPYITEGIVGNVSEDRIPPPAEESAAARRAPLAPWWELEETPPKDCAFYGLLAYPDSSAAEGESWPGEGPLRRLA